MYKNDPTQRIVWEIATEDLHYAIELFGPTKGAIHKWRWQFPGREGLKIENEKVDITTYVKALNMGKGEFWKWWKIVDTLNGCPKGHDLWRSKYESQEPLNYVDCSLEPKDYVNIHLQTSHFQI